MPHNRGPRRDGWIRGLSKWKINRNEPLEFYLKKSLQAPLDMYISDRWRIVQRMLEARAHGKKEVTDFPLG